MERSGNFYKAIQLGYILISILIGCMAYNSLYEWQEIEALELGNKKIDELRKEINNINIQMIKFSLLGETILEWNDKDIEHYHARRMAMDSMLCRFKATYPAERIDSVRSLLEDKERQMFQIVRLMDEQQSINKKIANQIPVIVQKSVQEQSKKPKRKGFLSIFGKKEGTKPTTTTTTLRSSNRNMVNEQNAQSRRLSEQADSLAARNAELNRQLQGLICQIEKKVQSDLQNRESEITAMRKKSFMQIGGLMGFVLLLLVISDIIIHRDAKNIKRYKRKTTDLIEQLEQSVQQNEILITSRKKAVYTITHELRTPLTAITGYTELLRKECNSGNNGQYIQNILQSSDRMRDMLNTLLDFFRLDNGKEQPRLSPCRISAITHTLETEFMPVAVNKGLSLSVKTGHDAIVLTDKERIIQIGNNLLSNAVKFTEEGGVSLINEYDKEDKEFIMMDQVVPSSNIERYIRYFDDIKVVVVDRDPRDVFLFEMLKLRGTIVPHDVKQFCEWYKWTRSLDKNKNSCTNKNIKYIYFEDLIYHYDETVESLIDFVGLDKNNHVNKFKYFKPEISKKNTRLWEQNSIYNEDIKYIEKELSIFLYNKY